MKPGYEGSGFHEKTHIQPRYGTPAALGNYTGLDTQLETPYIFLMKPNEPLTTRRNLTLADIKRNYGTDDACKVLLRDLRWPDGMKCPRCGNDKVYTLKKPFHWQCRNCQKNGYRFSVITKTIFENTNYPLRTWFEVIYLMSQSKKGMAALQLHRMMGTGSYKTAWYICTRIRAAMQDKDFPQLMGHAEVDETFVGGKDRNRHWNKKTRQTGGEASGKVGVIGAISRKGNIVYQIIENTDTATLDSFVRETVSDKVDLLATAEHSGYRLLKLSDLPHETVGHGQGEYIRGEVHTNNIESFWSLLKRGIMGTYHNVSKKYLPLYLAEFQFRHNNQRNPDIFRTILAEC
jgi:transposase-like protein